MKGRPPVSSPRGVQRNESIAVTEGTHSRRPIPEAHTEFHSLPTRKLQVDVLRDEADLNAFIQTVSGARFNRYLKASNGDKRSAVALHHANAKISQCLYLPIQIWEIALRNRLNTFLIWKYNSRWPWDQRALRALSSGDKRRLSEVLDRQARRRGSENIHTDAVVADLSAGFWVSLLTKSYDVPFVWRNTIARIFPADTSISREDAYRICEKLLDLRNRIAHHEPIYHRPLPAIHDDMDRIIAALCDRHGAYLSFASTFATDWLTVKECLDEATTK